MEITRIIHPVGQGGFYSERLYDYDNDTEITVIYDCGGNNQEVMKSCINKGLNHTQLIDAVFISHLHDDHINGLKYLLENFNVRYLFLPQLMEDEIYEAFLYNCLHSPGSIANSLILQLYFQNETPRYFPGAETRIATVPRSEENDIFIEGNSDDVIDIDLSQDNGSIENKLANLSKGKNHIKIHFKNKWLYVPYNPPVKTVFRCSFYDYFKKELNDGKDFFINDIKSIVEKKKDECKKVYKDFFGTHNAYSMTLFSGANPVDLRDYRYAPIHYLYWNYPRLWRLRSPNCLYMGDFETKEHFNQLRQFYEPFWRDIESIQVPHHGSRNNHVSDLYDYARLGFISVGENNRYRHPNIDTFIKIKEMGCEPILITESPNTETWFRASDDRHYLRYK